MAVRPAGKAGPGFAAWGGCPSSTRGHSTLTDSRPDVDAHLSFFLGTARPPDAGVLPANGTARPTPIDAGGTPAFPRHPHLWDAPFPGHPCQVPFRFDRTGFARANRFRSVERPWSSTVWQAEAGSGGSSGPGGVSSGRAATAAPCSAGSPGTSFGPRRVVVRVSSSRWPPSVARCGAAWCSGSLSPWLQVDPFGSGDQIGIAEAGRALAHPRQPSHLLPVQPLRPPPFPGSLEPHPSSTRQSGHRAPPRRPSDRTDHVLLHRTDYLLQTHRRFRRLTHAPPPAMLQRRHGARSIPHDPDQRSPAVPVSGQ